jgi:DNA-binding NarL/FixJ family response regulator
VQAAILAGASGFLDKTVTIHCLVDAIKAVAQGNAYFGGPASNMIFNILRASGEEGVASPALSTT